MEGWALCHRILLPVGVGWESMSSRCNIDYFSSSVKKIKWKIISEREEMKFLGQVWVWDPILWWALSGKDQSCSCLCFKPFFFLFSHPSGTEPWYFYFINGFLNFNVVFVLALLVLPLTCVMECLLQKFRGEWGLGATKTFGAPGKFQELLLASTSRGKMCLEKQGVWFLSFTETLDAPGMAQSIILKGEKLCLVVQLEKSFWDWSVLCTGVFSALPGSPCSGKCPHGCGYAESLKKRRNQNIPYFTLGFFLHKMTSGWTHDTCKWLQGGSVNSSLLFSQGKSIKGQQHLQIHQSSQCFALWFFGFF